MSFQPRGIFTHVGVDAVPYIKSYHKAIIVWLWNVENSALSHMDYLDGGVIFGAHGYCLVSLYGID